MNTKLAKQLRKEAGYHPSQTPKYVRAKKSNDGVRLDPESPKAAYRLLKKNCK